MQIRFHLDEHVNHAIANGLRRRGIDVRTTAEAGLIGGTDEVQLASAYADHRVMVTHDADYLRLHRRGALHAGITYCHPRRRTIGQIVVGLTLIWRSRSAEQMQNRIEYI
jgi:hypothetical protein